MSKKVLAVLIDWQLGERKVTVEKFADKFCYSERVIHDIVDMKLQHLSEEMLFTVFQGAYQMADTAYLLRKERFVSLYECDSFKEALLKVLFQTQIKPRYRQKKIG